MYSPDWTLRLYFTVYGTYSDVPATAFFNIQVSALFEEN